MKVSIIGATGYAGAELLRILYGHPQAEVVHITSESHTEEPISAIYPHLDGIYDLKLESMKDIVNIGKDSDFVFIGGDQWRWSLWSRFQDGVNCLDTLQSG